MKLQEYPLKMGFIILVLWLTVLLILNILIPDLDKNCLFRESYYFYIMVVIVKFWGVGLWTSIIDTI